MPIFFGAISLPQMRKSGISTLRSMATFFFFPLFFPKVVNSIYRQFEDNSFSSISPEFGDRNLICFFKCKWYLVISLITLDLCYFSAS